MIIIASGLTTVLQCFTYVGIVIVVVVLLGLKLYSWWVTRKIRNATK